MRWAGCAKWRVECRGRQLSVACGKEAVRGEKREGGREVEVARGQGRLEEKEVAGIEKFLGGDRVKRKLKCSVSTVASPRL